MKFRNCLSAAVSGLVGLLLLGQVACAAGSGPAAIEEIGNNWVRLNGIPGEDVPYIEIGCAVGTSVPTRSLYVGSDAPGAADTKQWRVDIGDWSTEDRWEWNNAPGFRGGLTRRAGRPLEFDIFREMVSSDVDTMRITMDEAYTFTLSGDVRDTLRDKFPESCYTPSN